MSEKGEIEEKLKAEETVLCRGPDHQLDDRDLSGVEKSPSVITEGFHGFDRDQVRSSFGFESAQPEILPGTLSGWKDKKSCDFPSLEIKKRASDVINVFDNAGVIFTNSLPVVEDSDFKCPMCENVSTSLSDLDAHLLSHKGNALYSCSHCDKRFTTDDYLREHSLDHGGTRVYKCAECEFITTARGTFHTHALIHIDVRPHKCPFCGRCFRTHSQLKNHKRRHTGDKPYSCTKCEYRASGVNSLKAHMLTKVHNNEKPFKCSICSSDFSQRRGLQEHMITHSEERPFSCSTCDKSFKTKLSLKSHSILHKSVFYYCSYCEFRTKHKANLMLHERTHTGDYSREKFVNCHLCGSRIKKKCLKTHLQTHAEVGAYKCSHCEYRGKTKTALTQHEKTHNNYFVSCTLCPKKYTTAKYLKFHFLKFHTKERPFQCSLCDYAAVEKKCLKAHIMKHTGEYPYRCEICNLGFTSSSYLRRHHRTIHSEAELIKCSLCDHRTKYQGNLRLHIRIKHNKERPFKCNVCPQTFISKNALIAHTVQHSGLRPYKCHLCAYAGIEERSLKAHLATHGKSGKKRAKCLALSDLKCSICPFLARGKVNFKKHLLLHVKKSYVKLYRLPM